jgi:hypothetical protein
MDLFQERLERMLGAMDEMAKISQADYDRGFRNAVEDVLAIYHAMKETQTLCQTHQKSASPNANALSLKPDTKPDMNWGDFSGEKNPPLQHQSLNPPQ